MSAEAQPVRDLLEPGQLVAGRYRVERLVGRGSTGEVYAARDEQLRVTLALKALSPAVDPARRERIVHREVRLARQITHASVCRLFDMGTDGPITFVTMELLSGETLADRLARNGRFSPADALPLVEQLVGGLGAAHEAGVVHGDFKPGNVILVEGESPRAVITDFGLARAPGAEASMTTHSLASGSPGYISPEQVMGHPATIASDLYALGVTMFELVTGELPFAASSPVVAAMKRVDEDAPRASRRVPGLDRRWDYAIARCLARDPAERFTSAAQIVAALRTDHRPRRGRAAGLVVAAVLACALVVVLALLVRRGSPRPPALIERRPTGPVAMAMRLGADRWGMIQQVIVDPQTGDMFLIGHIEGAATIGGRRVAGEQRQSRRAYAARLAADGHARWVRVLGPATNSHGSSIALAGDQLVVVGHQAGEMDFGGGVRVPGSSGTQDDCWIGALDARRGTARWAIGCEASVFGHARRVVSDDQGRAYVIGEAAGDVRFGGDRVQHIDPAHGGRGWFVAGFEHDGRLRWVTVTEHTLISARAKTLAIGGDTLYFTAMGEGRTRFGGADVASLSGRDAWMGAIDTATGGVRWLRRYSGSGNEELPGVTLLPDGRIAATATFTGELAVVPGETLRSRGLEDAVVIVCDRDGTPRRSWQVASEAFDGLGDIVATPRGLVAIGRTGATVDVAGQRAPATGLLMVRIDPDSDRVELRSLDAFLTGARTIAMSPAGTMLVCGRLRQRLRAGDVELRVPDVDGFVLELRDLP